MRGRSAGKRRRTCCGRMERRVHQQMVKVPRRQRRRHGAKVALMDRETDAVQRRVAAGKVCIIGLKLEAVQLEARHPSGKAEGGRARAATEFEDGLARGRRHEGGEEDRIRGSAVTTTGLQKGEPPAEEGVPGERILREAHGSDRTSTSFARRMARARKASASATTSRRGKMPMPPSMMLMWTSRTKQSISSARNSAVEKAMTVGSVVRRISFMDQLLLAAAHQVERDRT